ncbi:MAG: aminoacetone oxidase family FAD-binding enzyme [Arcobacter sp.]|nr:MAG: aminoacetone oxidase family FAD-binding enzyme [Arcobacter sp.]
MLATQLYKKGFDDIVIIEHNPRIGMKIKVSGGGKCNVTNEEVSEDNYLGESNFVKNVLLSYTPRELLDFLNKRKVYPSIRSLGQYFCKKSADEVINALEVGISKKAFLLSRKVLSIEKNENYSIHTDKGVIQAQHLVIATGSNAYPQVGGSDIGLSLAKNLGHTYTSFSPVLVGWTVQKEQFWMKDLSGLSTYVSIDVGHKKLFGELLFAHKGISGPAVLSASLYWKKGLVYIDFLAKASLKETFSQKKKQVSTQMGLPKRLSKLLLESIKLKDKSVEDLNGQDWEKLELLKAYPMSPAGNFGLKKAEACIGGVHTDEVDSNSMESKLHDKLYFLGEVLDVTGELGGYNFQWAFASAVVCASALEKSLIKENV